MNSLNDLKKAFLASGYKIKSSIGYELVVCNDTYSMALDVFYRNGKAITKKDLILLIKPKK